MSERWRDCHLDNGAVCSHHRDAGDGYCLLCGHEASCHEHERFNAVNAALAAGAGAGGGEEVDGETE